MTEALDEDARGDHPLPDEEPDWGSPIGRLWTDAYACVWPRAGGGGTCSHYAPDSCDRCDGSWLR